MALVFILRYCQHLIVAVFDCCCIWLILYVAITKISQLWIVLTFQWFFLRRSTCSVECPRACEVSDWTEWSKYDSHITEMADQKETRQQLEMWIPKVPGHVPEGEWRKRGSADGDPEEGESHSSNARSWGTGLLSFSLISGTHIWHVETTRHKLWSRYSKWSW